MGHQEADHRFQKLLTCLSHPPSYTCVRASTHLAPLEEVRHRLREELKKVSKEDRFVAAPAAEDVFTGVTECVSLKQQMCGPSAEEASVQILSHPQVSDVLLLPVDGPRYVRNAGSFHSSKEKDRVTSHVHACVLLCPQTGDAAQLGGGGGRSVWQCRTERSSRLCPGDCRQP